MNGAVGNFHILVVTTDISNIFQFQLYAMLSVTHEIVLNVLLDFLCSPWMEIVTKLEFALT
jgi:hypothetical protein